MAEGWPEDANVWLHSGRKDRNSVTRCTSILVGCLALVTLLAGCGGDSAAEPTGTAASAAQSGGPVVLQPLTTGRDVSASDGRYSLRVPGEWVEYDDQISELAYRTVVEDPVLSVNIVREELGENTRVQAYAENARQDIGGIYRNVITISLSPVMVGSIEAYRWVYTATIGERERLFYQLFIVDGGQGFVLTGLAPATADVSTTRSTFDAIAGSLTFARG